MDFPLYLNFFLDQCLVKEQYALIGEPLLETIIDMIHAFSSSFLLSSFRLSVLFLYPTSCSPRWSVVLVYLLHALVILDQLGPIDHLAVAFILEQAEAVIGVVRFVGGEQLQVIEHRRGLLGTVLAGDGTQGILLSR